MVVALALIGFVLLQQGKGADMGASFGAGGSNTVFGSSGSGNFMTRTTAVLATLFFLISLILGSIAANKEAEVDQWENLEVPAPAAVEVQAPANSDVPVSEQAPKAQDEDDKESDVPQG